MWGRDTTAHYSTLSGRGGGGVVTHERGEGPRAASLEAGTLQHKQDIIIRLVKYHIIIQVEQLYITTCTVKKQSSCIIKMWCRLMASSWPMSCIMNIQYSQWKKEKLVRIDGYWSKPIISKWLHIQQLYIFILSTYMSSYFTLRVPTPSPTNSACGPVILLPPPPKPTIPSPSLL